ncbi:MAG: nicotinate-nucleotide adenylyltransferase [Candidatus Omnitrophota bacterium]
MRIGLLGGTFNPIHNVHIALAEGAMKDLALEKVIFIPAHIPPHKTPDKLIDAEDRFKMIELAIGARQGFQILRFEIDSKERSYSIKTLEYLSGSYPKNTEFLFLIGADALAGLNTWKDIDKVKRLCRFAVCSRPNFQKEIKDTSIVSFDISPDHTSSTDIRKRIRNGRQVTGLVPEAVEEYIKNNNLYK